MAEEQQHTFLQDNTMKYFLPLLFPVALFAGEVQLTWQDNSDNETHFLVKGRLEDGTWEEVGKTLANVNELSVDTQTHEAWQVFAENEWGISGGSNILEAGDSPTKPGSLRVKEKPQQSYNDVKEYKKYVQGNWRG